MVPPTRIGVSREASDGSGMVPGWFRAFRLKLIDVAATRTCAMPKGPESPRQLHPRPHALRLQLVEGTVTPTRASPKAPTVLGQLHHSSMRFASNVSLALPCLRVAHPRRTAATSTPDSLATTPPHARHSCARRISKHGLYFCPGLTLRPEGDTN